MATNSKPSVKKNSTATVELKQKPSDVYGVAGDELKRLAADDAASRKVDKALEEARGKDTVRLHVALFATNDADLRAQARHDEATKLSRANHSAATSLAQGQHDTALKTQKEQFTALTKQADAGSKSVLTATTKQTEATQGALEEAKQTLSDLAATNHQESIDLAEANQSAVVDLVSKSKVDVVKDLGKTRDQLLNGQAVLGESITTAQQAAQTAFDALAKSVKTVHESLQKTQESDGQAIMKLAQEQYAATLDLIKTVYNDLDTKMKHFREEVADDLEKMASTGGNQNASVRGDLNVVLSLLSDIRKDQIGRPERR